MNPNKSNDNLKPKLAYDYILIFNKLFNSGLLHAKSEKFVGEDAITIAKSYAFVHIADNIAAETNSLKAQIAFAERKISELQEQNQWQVERIKLLQEEIEFQKKLRTRILGN